MFTKLRDDWSNGEDNYGKHFTIPRCRQPAAILKSGLLVEPP